MLRRLVSHLPYIPASTDGPVIQCDASPWGAGATLKVEGRIVEYWFTAWRSKDAACLGVCTGLAQHMTFWGTLATMMCLMVWGRQAKAGVLILGDNTGGLQNVMEKWKAQPLCWQWPGNWRGAR